MSRWVGDTESVALETYSHHIPDEKNEIANFLDDTWDNDEKNRPIAHYCDRPFPSLSAVLPNKRLLLNGVHNKPYGLLRVGKLFFPWKSLAAGIAHPSLDHTVFVLLPPRIEDRVDPLFLRAVGD